MQEQFNPMVQSWHSKIDLPTPNPQVLYCVRKIDNYGDLGYCYFEVLVDRGGEPYQTVLFHNYADMPMLGWFIQDIKALVPLHCTLIREDHLIVFERDKPCPCGYEYNDNKEI